MDVQGRVDPDDLCRRWLAAGHQAGAPERRSERIEKLTRAAFLIGALGVLNAIVTTVLSLHG
jgi:hypothetical protein